MAKRGSKKARSVEQEDRVAELYEGVRSRSSGAADNDQGDVRTFDELIECKMTGGPEQDAAREAKGLPPRRASLPQIMEKVALEAWSEDRYPTIALRYWAPESKLANREGWVDLIVRSINDDLDLKRRANGN